MTRRTLLMTTILSTSFMFGTTFYASASEPTATPTNTITANSVLTSNAPLSGEAVTDPHVAAQSFVAHVNYARLALVMKNADLARQHIVQARNMITLITNSTTEQRRVAHVSANRVDYEFETKHKYNYFPLEAGRMEIKEVTDGPLWAKNSLAVSDAQIVTLSLDLSNNKAESYLADAELNITSGKLMDAEIKLGELTDAVVSVDNKISVPIDKAHDNIAIAQDFLKGGNYNGARYALGHAEDALDVLQKDDAYKNHRAGILAMRNEVKDMRAIITKKDPTLLQKSGVRLDKWMTELKAWAKK